MCNSMSSIRFTENKFPESQKALDHLVSNSMAGVVVIGENKKVEYVNDIVCSTLGYTSDEILGTDFQMYLHPDSRDWIDSIFKQRVLGNNTIRTYEARVLGKNGQIVDFLESGPHCLAGVIYQDINSVPLFNCLVYQDPARLGVGQVHRNYKGFAAAFLNLFL